jgi:hypothetical protein
VPFFKFIQQLKPCLVIVQPYSFVITILQIFFVFLNFGFQAIDLESVISSTFVLSRIRFNCLVKLLPAHLPNFIMLYFVASNAVSSQVILFIIEIFKY